MAFSVFADATFTQRLKKLRIQCGLTQKELSLKAGLAKDLVWRWDVPCKSVRQEAHGLRGGACSAT